MRIPTGLVVISTLFFLTMNSVHAQVDPGNDPAMWSYVDPTQFGIILVALVVVGGGFTIYFRRKPAPKGDNA
ncbi:hypothetical protein [Candidatus Nitrosotalea okcheonensis]|uniref:Uncharacterized protein n=1 Tax=Candidatus Nitrosotalea okcheonensis TaxID=1903276 RepID=A0A2H1FD18_9ARCH|nr:hypothetical protein [Candidatus Nitrosotalea okcheonensis]MDE1832498.1 hypothetical protein [Nitrososphaerota archaeon]MDE1840557.1 hypothetical protein [Nitrososphaerota archaeon]MDE1878266.1 hypothetical protein [Nitrososphaerota archaeon]SMH70549.1 exported protein of unknown function [Candidatus Nitrosotalea okcheonensis]